MVPTNDFLPFATGGSANVESQASYAADSLRTNGNQPGVAVSAFNNKALRQANWIASVLAQFIANSSGLDVLDDANQTNLLNAMALTWPNSSLPTMTTLTATGTASGYMFTCTSANATVGATYTNNGHTYTVLQTLASGTQLFCSGASAPTSSGTLTKATGTGDSTITFSANQALATYTSPANVKFLKIKLVAGGAGGSISGTQGSVGTITAFDTVVAQGGRAAGTNNSSSAGGFGGTASLGAYSGVALTGGGGGSATGSGTAGGGVGGSSAFGGGGGGGGNGNNAGPGAVNTGGGGGGSGSCSSFCWWRSWWLCRIFSPHPSGYLFLYDRRRWRSWRSGSWCWRNRSNFNRRTL